MNRSVLPLSVPIRPCELVLDAEAWQVLANNTQQQAEPVPVKRLMTWTQCGRNAQPNVAVLGDTGSAEVGSAPAMDQLSEMLDPAAKMEALGLRHGAKNCGPQRGRWQREEAPWPMAPLSSRVG